jgi:anti-anti-sigma regulatory factor
MATSICEPATHHQHGITIIQLCEHKILGSSGQELEMLALAIQEAERRAEDAILLDFSRVRGVAEAGFALVAEAHARARCHGRRLLVCGLAEHDADHLRIHGLAGSLFSDPEAAVEDELAFRREVLCCA